jgi:hypothetical protein
VTFRLRSAEASQLRRLDIRQPPAACHHPEGRAYGPPANRQSVCYAPPGFRVACYQPKSFQITSRSLVPPGLMFHSRTLIACTTPRGRGLSLGSVHPFVASVTVSAASTPSARRSATQSQF